MSVSTVLAKQSVVSIASYVQRPDFYCFWIHLNVKFISWEGVFFSDIEWLLCLFFWCIKTCRIGNKNNVNMNWPSVSKCFETYHMNSQGSNKPGKDKDLVYIIHESRCRDSLSLRCKKGMYGIPVSFYNNPVGLYRWWLLLMTWGHPPWNLLEMTTLSIHEMRHIGERYIGKKGGSHCLFPCSCLVVPIWVPINRMEDLSHRKPR